jgi:ABC-2 type transport system permease protein
VRRLAAVAVKELRQVRRDPLSLLMLVAFPALMLVLYGFALNFDVRHVRLAVQDRDRSPASRELVASFTHSTYFDLVAAPGPGEDLDALAERGVVRAVLVIPEQFGRDLEAGRLAVVQFLDLAPRVLYNPELESTQFLLPGLIGLLMMITAVLSTALSVVREKERGTMEQLRVAPLRTFELILGKTFPYLGVSLLGTLIVLGAARLLFGVEVRGPHLDLLAVVLIYLFGALGFGLLISTIANNQTFAFQVGLITSLLPALLLSGFVFQIRIMPAWLQAITYLVPNRYFLVVLRGIILKGEGLATYWPQVGALVLYGLVVTAFASLRLARREA